MGANISFLYILFGMLAIGRFATVIAVAADAPATPPSQLSEQQLAAQWAKDEAQFKVYLPQFGSGMSGPALIVRTNQYITASAIPRQIIKSNQKPPSHAALFVVNNVTVMFNRVDSGKLNDLIAKFKADAPGVAIVELNTVPESLNPDLRDGSLIIEAIEMKPGAGNSTSIALKEDLFKQMKNFAATSSPQEALAALDKLRPTEIIFTNTRFHDGDKLDVACESSNPQAVTKLVEALRNSKIVTLDINKLNIFSKMSGITFQLNLTIHGAESPPKSATSEKPASPFIF